MKRLVAFTFLTAFFLSISVSATALPITNFGTEVGGIINQDVYIGSTSDGIVGDAQYPESKFSPNVQIDSPHNMNFIIDQYNLYNLSNPDLPNVINDIKYESLAGDPIPYWYETNSNDLVLPYGAQYISLKWGSANSGGGWFAWYVGDIWHTPPENITFLTDGSATFHFDLESLSLSHYTIWDSEVFHTPEPATFMLFGFGLIGAAVVGRRKKTHRA